MRLKPITVPWQTSPQVEPLTLTAAKAYLRVTGTDQDTVIARQIAAARAWAESFMHRALISQTWDMVLDGFPAAIELPLGRTLSVSHIAYTDSDGVTQTLEGASASPTGTDYREDLTGNDGGVLVPPRTGAWPAVDLSAPAPVLVRFTAGYGATAASIPQDIVSGIEFRLADLYENRGQQDLRSGWTAIAESFLRPHVVRRCV